MRTDSLPEPRVFHYSLDWRFLLPVPEPSQILVASEEPAGFGEALDRIGIPASNRISFASFREDGNRVQCIALPLGLPGRSSSRAGGQIDFYRSIRNRLCPGGYFLLGFRNALTSRSHAGYQASTPRRTADRLSRAGFKGIKVFGALPDLQIPEYIFELNTADIGFALQHRFRRKTVLLKMIRLLVRTDGLVHAANFLPCYFAVGTV